jgi:hypothetical protein
LLVLYSLSKKDHSTITESVYGNAPLEMMNTKDDFVKGGFSISTQFPFEISNWKSRFRDLHSQKIPTKPCLPFQLKLFFHNITFFEVISMSWQKRKLIRKAL